MSIKSLSIGIFPMVFLKNSSSMVPGLTDRRVGSISRSFPNRNCWAGYVVWMYLLRVIWAWSWRPATVLKSPTPFRSSVEEGPIAKMKINLSSKSSILVKLNTIYDIIVIVEYGKLFFFLFYFLKCFTVLYSLLPVSNWLKCLSESKTLSTSINTNFT